jgi:ribosomal protein L35
MKIKTKKTIAKRFKVSKNKKALHRHGGQDHFNSREPGKVTRAKRTDGSLAKTHAQNVKRLMPYQF